MRNLKNITFGIVVLLCLAYFASANFAVSVERDDFIILGRSCKDSEGKSVLMEEKIILRTTPNVSSPEQGRLESGTSVLVLDKRQFGTETFYLIMKVGEGGGLSGWVSEDYIYEVLSGPPQE
jgi:hypothetical protein